MKETNMCYLETSNMVDFPRYERIIDGSIVEMRKTNDGCVLWARVPRRAFPQHYEDCQETSSLEDPDCRLQALENSNAITISPQEINCCGYELIKENKRAFIVFHLDQKDLLKLHPKPSRSSGKKQRPSSVLQQQYIPFSYMMRSWFQHFLKLIKRLLFWKSRFLWL